MIIALVKINNFFIRLFKRKILAAHVMVLLPHCLQKDDCDADLETSVQNCRRCHKCGIADIAELCEARGLNVFLVSGGQLALSKIKQMKPRFVIAVACDKELMLGLVSIFPIPVYALENERPNGPCKNTCVQIAALERAIDRFVL
jgi:hypothetical protein